MKADKNFEVMMPTNKDQLPKILPILSVPEGVLMPKAQLPFYIYEPRYLALIADIMNANCHLGLIQTCSAEDQEEILFNSGTLCKLISIQEVDDNGLIIFLEGICRFDKVSELETTKPYSKFIVSYDRYEMDCAGEVDFLFDRSRLFKALQDYFQILGIELDWNELNNASNEKLISSLTMLCPLEVRERQALLEVPHFKDQSEMITRIIEMANLSFYHDFNCH